MIGENLLANFWFWSNKDKLAWELDCIEIKESKLVYCNWWTIPGIYKCYCYSWIKVSNLSDGLRLFNMFLDFGKFTNTEIFSSFGSSSGLDFSFSAD